LTTFAILATGPSLSQELADFVRDKCSVVAVSDAFRLAPWATALVSNDAAWWRAHPDALKFVGRKFSAAAVPGVERLPLNGHYQGGTNSGLQGFRVAEMLGATKIILLGFDLNANNGAHFFGNHPSTLRNTTPQRFAIHIKQFDKWNGCEVLNCTPGSSLKRFPFADIHEVLHP
jgi:hypothetical protein